MKLLSACVLCITGEYLRSSASTTVFRINRFSMENARRPGAPEATREIRGKFVKTKIVFRSACRFLFLLFTSSCLLVFLLTNAAYADYAEDLKDKTSGTINVQEEPSLPYVIKPVSRITFQDSYYSDHADRPYCFENSEGRCLDKQNNFFTTLEGDAQFGNRFFVYYKTELNEDNRVSLKKAYGLLRMGIWSLEVGKDTIWVGPGYHGSLLLSNNAEGFNLVRLRTEEPFRLPWIFSHIGEFKYDIFRGWTDNPGILGHRLSWRPVPLLEIGANQVVYIPRGKNYDVWQYPHIFFSSADNVGSEGQSYNNDQKSSLDVALDMPFLSKVSPFVNGRIYAEYGGNDTYALWQKEDAARMRHEPLWKKLRWPFQFDFLNIGWLTGLFLTTGDVDFRFEYAQNYASYPIFYDWYAEFGPQYRRHGPWYSNLNTLHGMIMGHEMGNDADDYYLEMNVRHAPGSLKIYYDQERHGLSSNVTYPPERRNEYGLRPAYQYENFLFFADLIYNHYKNVNFSTNPVQYDIHAGTELDEFIAGLGVEITF